MTVQTMADARAAVKAALVDKDLWIETACVFVALLILSTLPLSILYGWLDGPFRGLAIAVITGAVAALLAALIGPRFGLRRNDWLAVGFGYAVGAGISNALSPLSGLVALSSNLGRDVAIYATQGELHNLLGLAGAMVAVGVHRKVGVGTFVVSFALVIAGMVVRYVDFVLLTQAGSPMNVIEHYVSPAPVVLLGLLWAKSRMQPLPSCLLIFLFAWCITDLITATQFWADGIPLGWLANHLPWSRPFLEAYLTIYWVMPGTVAWFVFRAATR